MQQAREKYRQTAAVWSKQERSTDKQWQYAASKREVQKDSGRL
jgi:hypothetical protein